MTPPTSSTPCAGRMARLGLVTLALATLVSATVTAQTTGGYILGEDGAFTWSDSHSDEVTGAEQHIQISEAELPEGVSLDQGSLLLSFSMPETDQDDELRLVSLDGPEGKVSLGVRRGMVIARIGNEEGPLPTIIDRVSQAWAPGEMHSVELRWMVRNGETVAVLLSDGQVSGASIVDTVPSLKDGKLTLGGDAVRKLIYSVIVNPEPDYPKSLLPGERTIRVDAGRSVGEAYRFWSVVNWNQPHLLTDPQVMKDLPQLRPFIDEINCVYLLGGRWEGKNEWYKGVSNDGEVIADFSGMIAQIEAVIAAGYTPRIVLDNVPFGMSDPVTLHSFGNTAPPFDELVWGKYVEKAVQAMVEAFGRSEVSTWRFRVGTEPDLNPGHWSGTAERFLEHYDHTVEAVARVLPEAMIGPGNILNPAASDHGLELGMKWGLSIIDHAATGENAVTGKQGSRLDWFSYTWYGRVGSSLDLFDNAYLRTRAWLDKYPQFERVPITIGEFAVLGDEFGRRLYAGDTSEWAASFYAALAERTYAYGIEKVYEWDQTTLGIYHPRAHVIGMLEKMAGGQLLEVVASAESSARAGAIAVRKDEKLYILLFNHRPWRSPKVSERIRLTLNNLDSIGHTKARRWRLSEWVIDENSSVWIRQFEADADAAGLERLPRAGSFEGSPFRAYGDQGVELFKRNIDRYRQLSALPMTRHSELLEVNANQIDLEFDMEGHSVRFLEIWPADEFPTQTDQ